MNQTNNRDVMTINGLVQTMRRRESRLTIAARENIRERVLCTVKEIYAADVNCTMRDSRLCVHNDIETAEEVLGHRTRYGM